MSGSYNINSVFKRVGHFYAVSRFKILTKLHEEYLAQKLGIISNKLFIHVPYKVVHNIYNTYRQLRNNSEAILIFYFLPA